MVEAPVRERSENRESGGIAVSGVSRTFATSRGRIEALADVTVEVPAGSVVAIVGPSGCGKTTLLELICGLQTPDRGTIFESSRRADAPARPAAPVAVGDRQRRPRPPGEGPLPCAARAQAAPLFASFGLEGFERSSPAELSGGMRQRVSFLRSLLAGKPVLALDEPFAALDAITRAEMQAWLAGAPATEVSDRRARHPRRRGGRPARRPGRRHVAAPGRIVADIPVPHTRPRERTVEAIVALRAQAFEALGVRS